MSEGIRWVRILIQDVRIGYLGIQTSGDGDVTLGTVKGRLRGSAHNLGTQRFQNINLFLAHLFRHCDYASVALDGRCQGNADACVTARGLDEGIAGLDPALPLGVFDHPPADPILDTPPGIEEFALGQNLHAVRCQPGHLLGDGVEPDERRVADGRKDVGADRIAGGDEGRQSSGGGATLLGAFGGIAVDVTGGIGRRLRIFGACGGRRTSRSRSGDTLLGRAGIVRRCGRDRFSLLLGHA
mmetsp:Transcript_2526/g.7419  ORF Transcript_2526/g.7419 Transcript_2526/m.7419 type:complete len:241 (-) Transcript_2526:2-724(-)